MEEPQKIKTNLFLPAEVMAAFDEAAGLKANDKKKWYFYTAAMLLFIDESTETRQKLLQRIASIGFGTSFDDLIREAQSGKLREELRVSLGHARRGSAGLRMAASEDLPEDPTTKSRRKG